MTLYSSSDLTNWREKKEVIKGLSTRFHGFNYPHMVIDGNDIVFVSRTAWEDSRGPSQRWHDANMFTFHRIRDFRNGTGTPPPPPTGEYQRIKVRSSGHCLYVAKDSREAGGTIIQWNCGNYDNEAFEIIDAGGGYVKFKAKSCGLCLNVYGNSNENGADIIQWDCGSRTAFANEHFKMESKGGWFSLVARNSGKCVDIFRNSSEPDANVQQWSCNNNANQQFRFE